MSNNDWLKARWYILGAVALFAVLIGWFLFRAEFYVFMIHRGKGEWASTHLAHMKRRDRDFYENLLQSPKWHVRCSIIRTLRKMSNKDFALPILVDHARREQDASCRLELAVAFLKYGEYDSAKPVLQALRTDEKWSRAAEDILRQLEEKTLDAAPPPLTSE